MVSRKMTARKADGIRRRWCKSSRPIGRALMGESPENLKTV